MIFDVKKSKEKNWRFLVLETSSILELGWEMDYIHLKILYIEFRELSNGISGLRFYRIWFFIIFLTE